MNKKWLESGHTYPVIVIAVKGLVRFVDIKELNFDAKPLKVTGPDLGCSSQCDIASMRVILVRQQEQALGSDALSTNGN